MTGSQCRHKLWLSICTLALAIPSAALAEEEQVTDLLNRMSAEIAALDDFIVHGDSYSDARLSAGQIIEHSAQVRLHMVRETEQIRISNKSAEGAREIYFDGSQLSLFDSQSNVYAQRDVAGGLDGLLEFVTDQAEVDSPMLDFIAADVANTFLDGAVDLKHLGQSLIRGKIYEHIGIRYEDVDVQIWIASDGPTLPGKMSISAKWEGGAPRFVGFMTWDIDPNIEGEVFRFEPPDDAVNIGFLGDTDE